MKRAKVFKSDNSPKIKLLQKFEFKNKEVEIFQRKKLTKAFELLKQFPQDCFPEKRKDTPPQERDS